VRRGLDHPEQIHLVPRERQLRFGAQRKLSRHRRRRRRVQHGLDRTELSLACKMRQRYLHVARRDRVPLRQTLRVKAQGTACA
jgi:hypothetical protein